MKRGKTPLLTVEAYRAILLAKKAELTSAPSPAAPGLAEFGRIAEDDQAPVLHDQFISFQVKSLDYQMLKQIDAALDRLARGGFGVCAACGEDISPKRLAAIPWAHCCITCQERTGSAGAAASADQQAA